MKTNLFINLAVKDLKKSMAFFSKLGFEFNPRFTDDNAACMMIEDNISAMLISEPMFKTFVTKEICDPHKSTEVLLCLSVPNRKDVDERVVKAIAAGGRAYKDPLDHGFMYYHAFEDLDGHIWEVMYLDPNHPANK